MNPKLRHHASPPSETFAYRGAEWHRKSLGTTGLMYDGDNVVADIDGSVVSRFYVTPMLDQNVSMTVTGGDQAGTYWYSQDERQSVRTLTDSTGAVVARYDYTAFGEPVPGGPSPVVQQRFTYTGRELNPHSGNHFFRYRTYEPDTDMFQSRDPLGYQIGFAGLYSAVFASHLSQDAMGLVDQPQGSVFLRYVKGRDHGKGVGDMGEQVTDHIMVFTKDRRPLGKISLETGAPDKDLQAALRRGEVKAKDLRKAYESIMPKIRQELAKGAAQAQGVVTQRAATSQGKRILRKIPYVGFVVAMFFIAETVDTYGAEGAVRDTALNVTPGVNVVRFVAEVCGGQDWVEKDEPAEVLWEESFTPGIMPEPM